MLTDVEQRYHIHINTRLGCLMPLSTIFQLYRGSLLLVQETGVPGENHRPATSHLQTLSLNVVSSTPCLEWDSSSQR